MDDLPKSSWYEKKLPRIFWSIPIAFAGMLVAIFAWYWIQLDLPFSFAMNSDALGYVPEEASAADPLPQKPDPIVAKGIYLTAYSVSSPQKLDAMIELIEATELNAVVLDIKDYTGKVLYNTDVALANDKGLVEHRIPDLSAVVDTLHEHDIYVIARQTVFQDPALAEAIPEWAIQSKYGGIWRDHKGLSWVDPTNKHVWNYNLDIAKDAIKHGVDEVNFDYVRFPSDGNMSAVVYTNGDRPRYEIMGSFYFFLGDRLKDEPAFISADLFGFVMERHDGMSIGQRLEDIVDHMDYISPMMYPSHYPVGHLGLQNPAAHPYTVINNGMAKGMPHFEEKRAQVRPWIQAFNIGAVYGAQNIRAQIDAIEQYDNAGWLLWNASNRYSSAGLKPAETSAYGETL